MVEYYLCFFFFFFDWSDSKHAQRAAHVRLRTPTRLHTPTLARLIVHAYMCAHAGEPPVRVGRRRQGGADLGLGPGEGRARAGGPRPPRQRPGLAPQLRALGVSRQGQHGAVLPSHTHTHTFEHEWKVCGVPQCAFCVYFQSSSPVFARSYKSSTTPLPVPSLLRRAFPLPPFLLRSNCGILELLAGALPR